MGRRQLQSPLSPVTTSRAVLPSPTRGPKNTWAPPRLSTESKIYWLFTADFTFHFPLSHPHKVIALVCTCMSLFAEGAEPLPPRLRHRPGPAVPCGNRPSTAMPRVSPEPLLVTRTGSRRGLQPRCRARGGLWGSPTGWSAAERWSRLPRLCGHRPGGAEQTPRGGS